jgi:hypothetical protein
VGIATAALLSNVAEVDLTVSAGGGPFFEPFTMPLSQAQDSWTVFLTAIPPGPQRQFDVAAYDASHVLVQTGSGRVDVVAGETALVLLTLGSNVPPAPFQNQAPVIDFLTASSASAPPGASVRLGMSAHDPDPLDMVTESWAATCGTLSAAGGSVTTWTAPATYGRCQISATASDDRGATVTLYLAIDVVPPSAGAMVVVQGGPNSAPVIMQIVSNAYYQSPVVGDLRAIAVDPDGDPMSYAWSSSCSSLAFTNPGSATTGFSNPDGSLACVVTATVADPNGGRVTGAVTLPPRLGVNYPPVITQANQPFVDASDPRKATPVLPGESVVLSVQAYDPEGQLLAFEWAAYGGTLDGEVDVRTSPGRSAIVFHASSVMPADAYVVVTVRDVANESTTHVFPFRPGLSDCTGQPDGTPCTDGNPCTRTDLCQAGVCVGQDPVTCPIAAPCKDPGVCQPSGPAAGTCTYADSAVGTTCSDGVGCTGPDACAAGVCVPGPSLCTGNAICDTGSGMCVCTSNCTGRVCGDDGCGGSCGTCITGTCNAAGRCAGTSVLPQPAVAKQIPARLISGVALDPAGRAYATGQIACTFDPSSGSCASVPFEGTISATPAGANDGFVAAYDGSSPYAARWVTLLSGQDEVTSRTDQSVNGVAVTSSGAVVVHGTSKGGLVSANGVISLPNVGASQVFLATLSPSGDGQWAKAYALPNGRVNALVTFGNRFAICGSVDRLSSFAPKGFAYRAATVGNRDAILAVFDVDPITGVATLAWSKQLGAGANEYCAGAAFDPAGNLVVAGPYSWDTGTTLLDPGLGPLADPNGTNPSPSSDRTALWVAKYGPGGAILAQAAFGDFGSDFSITPSAIAVDAFGDVAIVGGFVNTLTLPGVTTLVSAGSADAFFLELSPSFAPIWSSGLGAPGSAADFSSSVAIASTGEVLAVGSFFGPTSGATTLPYAAGNGQEAFLAEFSPTGSTEFGQAFGGPGLQSVSQIAVNPSGTGAARDLMVLGGTYSETIAFPPLAQLPSSSAGASYLLWAPLLP